MVGVRLRQVTSVLYLAHVTWRGRDILKNLLVFGLFAGLTELAADWWLVSVTKTLHYEPWGPFIIDSPAYMPMSWAGILLSMGFFGWVVSKKYGLAKGMLFSTVVTGIYVPIYEGLAHYAGWWTYTGVPMLGVVPWYIIIGEALVGAVMTPLVMFVLDERGLVAAAFAGVAAGLWIWAAYFIAMVLT
ncbi:MAG: hypothetical protein JNK82_24740 [Myxococcaceae bacterium]|nr:hypothetical protein [Myxococcaceae bacterium]